MYMNNKFVDRIKLMFVDKDNSVEPCLSVAQLLQAGVKEEALKTADPKTPCLAFQSILPASDFRFDHAKLRFDLSIPQKFVKNVPRGYVDPKISLQAIRLVSVTTT